MTYDTISLIHRIVVSLFLLTYLVKTILLLFGKNEALDKFTKTFKVPEMIISFLFLATGIFLVIKNPNLSGLFYIKIAAVLISIPIAIIGFKKRSTVLAATSLILIIGAYGLAEMAKKKHNKPIAIETTNVNGEEIYKINCARCHGENGKLSRMKASDLSISTLDNASIREVISKGRGDMVGFEGALTPEQIEAVAKHVESLR